MDRHNNLPNHPDEIEVYSTDYGSASDMWMDSAPPRPRWTAGDVAAYRSALTRLGLSPDEIECQVASTCGVEWVVRPMLSVRQAGGM